MCILSPFRTCLHDWQNGLKADKNWNREESKLQYIQLSFLKSFFISALLGAWWYFLWNLTRAFFFLTCFIPSLGWQGGHRVRTWEKNHVAGPNISDCVKWRSKRPMLFWSLVNSLSKEFSLWQLWFFFFFFFHVACRYYSDKHWFPPQHFLAREASRGSFALFTSLLLHCTLDKHCQPPAGLTQGFDN